MSQARGFQVEKEMAEAINKKKIKDLPQNLKYVIQRIYGKVDENEMVFAERIGDSNKPDIWVEYRGNRKFISIKCGHATEVHTEKVSTITDFLKKCGISEESLHFFLEYSYGDKTEDGTGHFEMPFHEMKKYYAKRAAKFNEEINSNDYLLYKLIDRALFIGSHGATPAEFIYFGNVKYGEIVSRKEVMRQAMKKKWSFMTNPHFGPLQFKMDFRGPVRNPKYEYKRHMVVFWWANLKQEVGYICGDPDF